MKKSELRQMIREEITRTKKLTEGHGYENTERAMKSLKKGTLGPGDIEQMIRDLMYGQPTTVKDVKDIINPPDTDPLSPADTDKIVKAYIKDLKKSKERPKY